MHRRSSPPLNLGFTLIELIVGITILGILSSVALPSFMNMIQNNRQASVINAFIADLHFARSEAIKRNSSISLCKSSNGTGCDISTDNNWNRGWIVFDDTNSNGVANANEVVLRVGEALTQLTLRTTQAFNNNLIYSAKGLNAALTAGSFRLCDNRGAGAARAINITATGQPRAAHTQFNGAALICL